MKLDYPAARSNDTSGVYSPPLSTAPLFTFCYARARAKKKNQNQSNRERTRRILTNIGPVAQPFYLQYLKQARAGKGHSCSCGRPRLGYARAGENQCIEDVRNKQHEVRSKETRGLEERVRTSYSVVRTRRIYAVGSMYVEN